MARWAILAECTQSNHKGVDMTETIFFIHGMWGGAWYWGNYRRFFENQGYRCEATTLRHHDMDPRGVPDPRLGTTGLLDYAADLEQEIRELNVKPILMGHSMGGLLSQMLAERGLAKAIVLVTPAPPSGNWMCLKPSVVRSFWSIQMKWGFWKKPMLPKFDAAVYSMLHLLPPDEQKETYEKFVYESGRAMFEIGYWLLDSNGAAKVDASKVACPVLVVAGAEDRASPPSVARPIAERYKSVSTYKEFEGQAHWMVAEPGWQEVAEYIEAWLSNCALAEDG